MIDKVEVKKLGLNIIDSNESKNELLEFLKARFPQTLSEGVVNLEAIATLLGLENMQDIKGYELTFTGKGFANALASTKITKELKLDIAKSKDYKNTNNAIIRGDNLDVLKILKAAYRQKIKMIYIDPPYNTGGDGFVYNDNFRDDYKQILKELGLLEMAINENGEEIELESETLKFFRSITRSKSHSGWLGFMLPRLKLARDLLREDGVIFISIDDNEMAQLKILCDEIFGEDNFCGNIIWLKGNAQNDADTIQRNQEYMLCYAKNIESKPIRQILQQEKVKVFKDSKTGRFYYEGAGLTTGGAGGTLNARPNLGFSIYYNPKTQDFFAKDDYDKDLAKISNDEQEVYTSDSSFLEAGYEIIRPPKKGVGLGRWTWALDKFNSNKNSVLIRKNTNGYIVLKKEWLDSKKVKQGENGEYYAIIDKFNPPKSFIDFAGSGSGTSELKKLFNTKVFTNPKNTKLLKHLLKISTSTHSTQVSNSIADNGSPKCLEPDIILDFFAGSGTTAHALMQLNAEDKGNRQFILVQLDEKIDSTKSKTAYDFCKNELGSENPNISDITIERVKRAGEQLAKDNPSLDTGFCVYSLESKPEILTDKEGHLKLVSKSILSPFDKARNLALQNGKSLDKKLDEILKDKLYKCEDCYYLITCDDEVLEYLAKTQSEYIYISGYEDINLQSFLNLQSSFKSRLNIVY